MDDNDYAGLIEQLKIDTHSPGCNFFGVSDYGCDCTLFARRKAASALTTLTQDSKRFEWCLPILTAQGDLGDSRALRLAGQFLRNLDGREAIDAAMKGESDGR